MIFEKIRIGKTKLENRIAISPMCQYSAQEDGCPSVWHYVHLGSLVKSGAGSLVIESTAVKMDGRISNKDLCLSNKRQANEMKKLIFFLKKINKIPIILQISHAGRKGSSYIPWIKKNTPLPKGKGWQTYSASDIRKDTKWPKPKKLTKKQINRVLNSFVRTCKIANKIGFDGIEIHMAHGYLLHQFLSPISNKRKDEFGGSSFNRNRFPLELSKKIRKIWPKNKILGARITGDDHVAGGININDAINFSKDLKKIGLNYICVSSGGILSKTKLKYKKDAFRLNTAAKIREKVKIKVRTSGNYKDFLFLKKILKAKKIDFVAIGRPFLKNPNWLFKYLLKENKKIAFQHL